MSYFLRKILQNFCGHGILKLFHSFTVCQPCVTKASADVVGTDGRPRSERKNATKMFFGGAADGCPIEVFNRRDGREIGNRRQERYKNVLRRDGGRLSEGIEVFNRRDGGGAAVAGGKL